MNCEIDEKLKEEDMKKFIFALIAGAAVSAAAQAQTAAAPHLYVGVGVATADHNYSLNGNGISNVDSDGYKPSAKVFGGYDFNQNWGVEVGYTDFRDSDFSYTQNGKGVNGTANGHSFYIAGKGTAPINEQFAAYGKLGVAYSTRNISTSTGLNVDNDDTGVYAAAGLQYNVAPQVALIAEYERYGKRKDFGAKADVITVGAKYSF
jgi:opacity protein-like surface antigen